MKYVALAILTILIMILGGVGFFAGLLMDDPIPGAALSFFSMFILPHSWRLLPIEKIGG